jgi:hypothetical protein
MRIQQTRRSIGAALAVMVCVLAWPALAAKPALSINVKLVKITVEIDTALKRYPGLFDNCLAEGKAWAKEMLGRAEKGRRENLSSFRVGREWPYDSNYVMRSAVGRHVSIVRYDQSLEDGAHPVTLIDTILLDRKTQERVNIRRFFTETADNGPTMTALALLTQLAVAAEKIAREIPAKEGVPLTADTTPEQYLQDKDFLWEGKVENVIKDRIKPALLKIGPVTLAPSTEPGKSSGLSFYYSQYELGPYVDGSDSVFVPWTAFRQYLSHDGTAIFAGARPKNDEERW